MAKQEVLKGNGFPAKMNKQETFRKIKRLLPKHKLDFLSKHLGINDRTMRRYPLIDGKKDNTKKMEQAILNSRIVLVDFIKELQEIVDTIPQKKSNE